MAQRPKQLAAALSAAHYFGAELRRHRESHGLSQADLGHRIRHSADLIRKVEDGSRIAIPSFVTACDAALDARGVLTRLSPLLERERRLRGARNDRDGYRSAAVDGPVLDWLVCDRRRLPAYAEGGTSADVLADLRRRDHQAGAGHTYESLTAVIEDELDELVRRAPRLAVGYLELAGYGAVDLGADGRAQAHYLRALRIATESGDLLYGGYLVAVSLAHLALHCGDANQALRLATAALRGTDRAATPAVKAAFHTVVARARARLGDEVGCTAALRHAEAELSVCDPSGEPEWIRYFGEADFADERAHCFFDLRKYDLVDRELGTALDHLPSTRVRRLAIDTALHASSLARRGDLEHACAAARAAVDYTAATASFRSIHRVVLMMAEFHRYGAQPLVADLIEYVRVTLPAGPAVHPGC